MQLLAPRLPRPEVAWRTRSLADLDVIYVYLDGFALRVAIFAVVGTANRSVEEARPWDLARAERHGDAVAARRLDATLWELGEALRVAEALRPLLPDAAERTAAQLGLPLATTWTDALRWGGLRPGTLVAQPTPLFPRREPDEP